MNEVPTIQIQCRVCNRILRNDPNILFTTCNCSNKAYIDVNKGSVHFSAENLRRIRLWDPIVKKYVPLIGL